MNRKRAVSASRSVDRPNILLIYTDDQSHRTVSCYPRSLPWVHTPHIDSLAAGGVRFAPSYIGAWCAPARATLLTGRHSCGVESMRSEGSYPGTTYDPEVCRFWPAEMRRAGYTTAQIGKWHSGADAGFGRDWDHQVVWNRCALPDNALHYYEDQMVSTDGGEPERVTEYSTDHYTGCAVEFLRGRTRPPDRPWLLWLCYDAPHGPFIPASRHRDAIPDAATPTPADIYPPRPGKPEYMQAVETWEPGAEDRPVMKRAHYQKDAVLRSHIERGGDPLPSSLPDWNRRYHRCVSALDEAVGLLLATLRETGQLENTLIVFTSDQGLAVGQHGFLDKHAPYDANIAAPLIFSMPGALPEGAVCDVAAGGADLAPTLLGFAGIAPPWPMHGHDLGPLLRDPAARWPHDTLLMNTHQRYGSDTAEIFDPSASLRSRPDRVPWWVLLRRGRYKYIRTLVPGAPEELYNLAADPEELDNLARQPAHRDTLVTLRKAMVDELRRVDAPFVTSLPEPRQQAERQDGRAHLSKGRT
ncbi:MAG: sulfatase-like hydrolase/transferase [Armatimonadota bacterium]